MSDALSIQGLNKTYANGFVALKGIDLRVREGDFFALLGPNGAGKSTTIGILSTLVNKSSGSVSVFGHDLDREPLQLKRCIGVVPQEFNFNQFELAFNILVVQAGYYLSAQRGNAAEELLKAIRVVGQRHTQARLLSVGM